MSGVGRAVMLLFKHPKESRNNRKIAGRIICEFAVRWYEIAVSVLTETLKLSSRTCPSNQKRVIFVFLT